MPQEKDNIDLLFEFSLKTSKLFARAKKEDIGRRIVESIQFKPFLKRNCAIRTQFSKVFKLFFLEQLSELALHRGNSSSHVY